ncbi:hypothetical protein ACFFMN_33840 [Planobispora siamensis]|uniref:Uncharacterized protein n=1 Tax=Planobispora siamensis TaxID=936338 RepID=A0A8J3WLM0_9ACTN|nr:hypothetical protein [Planobispora siamensis]GIH91966.1 hypothetical protein Psi01_25960 [Planobispora siamensis]
MHDPLTVAFEIRRPWPKKRDKNGWRYWPALVTVWHREPGSRDSGEVCKHHSRVQDRDGKWQWKFHHGWRFHIHHWRIQVHPLQELRRRLLTRCTWCGGRHRKGDAVNVSQQWNRRRGHWWQGEMGLYHRDCSSIAHAHRSCLCEDPITDHEGYGSCARCGRFRAYGLKPENLAHMRDLRQIPTGARSRPTTESCP